MKTLDARGLSCPEPVIMLRKALAGGEPCQMIVDNHAAKENTSRYGKSQGYQVAVQEQGSEYTLTFTKYSRPCYAGSQGLKQQLRHLRLL